MATPQISPIPKRHFSPSTKSNHVTNDSEIHELVKKLNTIKNPYPNDDLDLDLDSGTSKPSDVFGLFSEILGNHCLLDK